jgi:hypothetical protein
MFCCCSRLHDFQYGAAIAASLEHDPMRQRPNLLVAGELGQSLELKKDDMGGPIEDNSTTRDSRPKITAKVAISMLMPIFDCVPSRSCCASRDRRKTKADR